MSDYDDWARAFHGHAFLRRSAERNADFLLPSLRPGQRVLDVGCGPGAITRGLAERVAGEGGEAVGVDLDAGFVAQARSTWSEVPGLRFEEGDATDLPFEADSFDVAFAHALLQHVPDPGAVVAELRRVVRQGGVVALADVDLDAYLLHPQPDGVRRAVAADRRIRRSPDVGRRLPTLLHEAGFADVEFRMQTHVVTGVDATRGVGESSARRFEAAPFVAHARSSGWLADDDDPAELAAAWRRWGETPGAVFATFWCQALGR